MKSIALIAVCLSATTDDMVKGFEQYYDSLVGYREQAEAAEKAKDWLKAMSYYRQLQGAADGALKRIEQAKGVTAWKADLVFKTKDGAFKAAAFEAALKKLGTKSGERAEKAEAAAKDPKQQPQASPQMLKQLGAYWDALGVIDAAAVEAEGKKDPLTAGKKLEQLASSSKVFSATLTEQLGKGTLKPDTAVPVAKGKLTVKELAAQVAALHASAEKRLKATAAAFAAAKQARDEQLKEERRQQAAAAAERLAKKNAPAAAAAPAAAPGARAAPGKAPKPPPPAARVDYYATATFAYGRCNFGRCATDGWEHRGVTTHCNFGKCLTDGWESTDGSRTQCNFGNCMKDGWSTSHPDGTASDTRCNFGACLKDGWTTVYPDGSASETTCNFNACLTDGWTTSMPNGEQVQCTCSFQNCLENGAECN